PWENRYHTPDKRRKMVTIAGQERVLTRTVGDKPELMETKTINSVAPNFVHGLDGALVHLTAFAGIPTMAIHDCWGFRAPDADRGRQSVLDQFAQMYRADVLAEARRWAEDALAPLLFTWARDEFPVLPDHGNLNIEDFRNAEYIIS